MSKEEIDRMYEVYERIPRNTPDAWGDLESFLLTNSRHQMLEEDVWDAWPAGDPAVSG